MAVDTIEHSLGELGECVMSIYGIARSLGCRELGPTQLLPGIVELRESLPHHRALLQELLTQVRQHPTPGARLLGAADLLDGAFDRVFDEVATRLASARKLGARDRLELERHIERLGGDVQACHRLIGVMHAALAPRPIWLSITDLVRGRWLPQAAFVDRTVELCVKASAADRFEADPRLAWALTERSLHALPIGLSSRHAMVDATNPERPMLRVGDFAELTRVSLMRVRIELAPQLDVEEAVLEAIVEHMKWNGETSADEAKIVFRAA